MASVLQLADSLRGRDNICRQGGQKTPRLRATACSPQRGQDVERLRRGWAFSLLALGLRHLVGVALGVLPEVCARVGSVLCAVTKLRQQSLWSM